MTTWLGLTWAGWLLVALVWMLIPACYAVRRWRLRVFLVSEIRKREAAADWLAYDYETCLSCGLRKKINHVCRGCGFCGMVTVVDSPAKLLPTDIPPTAKSRLLNNNPVGAGEAKDSLRREDVA